MFKCKNKTEDTITEITPSKPVTYGFTYKIGFKSGQSGNFYNNGFATKEDAQANYAKTLEALKKASSEKIGVMIDTNIGINGEDISWFIVRDIEADATPPHDTQRERSDT